MSNLQSNPGSSAQAGKAPASPTAQGFSGNSGKDVIRYQAEYNRQSAATPARKTRKQLLELEPALKDTDWEILRMIRRCRVMLGNQIGRLCIPGSKNPRANVQDVNRKLKALSDLGLVATLGQKVSNTTNGYVAYVYYLTDAGERILQIHQGEPKTRRRNLEPSMNTLTHTLSVVECFAQTVEACRWDDMKLTELQLEPDCWRLYAHKSKNYYLKPDLALVTEKQDWKSHEEEWYELRWFIEVDLNTENIQTILEKCRRYYDYYKSDVEQQLHDDVFPLVVWIVKTEGRKQTIVRHIRETFRHYPRIFAVILPGDYTKLLRDELELEDGLCPL